MNDSLPRAPATARNRDAILNVLREEFAAARSVLEIGSGTGEHAAYFAPKLDWLSWQPSDRAINIPDIEAWVAARPASNLQQPMVLDVNATAEPPRPVDAVFSANTVHIMHRHEVALLFPYVGQLLAGGGRLCLYGPFNMGGSFTSDSNRAFDASLKSRDPGMGIRDIEWLDELAGAAGMKRQRLHEMPANNFIAVWDCSGAVAE